MDCATFESIVQDLDRPGTPAAGQCEGALVHAESCGKCAALLTQVEWLEFSLREVAKRGGDHRASPRVEAALLQEFRNAKALAARKQIPWRLAALAAAAALFLALGLSLRPHGAYLQAPSPTAPVQLSEQNSVPPTSAARSEIGQSSDANPRLAHKDSTSADMGDSDETSSFVRLPYADNTASDDGGAIVRVELPRAALASFGVPVPEIGDTQRILADLVVSADGTPEAIRLVSQTSANQEF